MIFRIFRILLLIRILFSFRFGPGWEIHKVIDVVDGDTIVLENGDHVRYISADTPETVHPDKPIECFGPEASEKNRDLVLNKYVLLERDIEDKDNYGRYLRYVYTLRGSVNKILVEEGFAYSYYYPPNIKHHDEYIKAELEAQDNSKGLWGECY